MGSQFLVTKSLKYGQDEYQPEEENECQEASEPPEIHRDDRGRYQRTQRAHRLFPPSHREIHQGQLQSRRRLRDPHETGAKEGCCVRSSGTTKRHRRQRQLQGCEKSSSKSSEETGGQKTGG